eukprot:1146078-Pelagomonas_calceolata.AAC.9
MTRPAATRYSFTGDGRDRYLRLGRTAAAWVLDPSLLKVISKGHWSPLAAHKLRRYASLGWQSSAMLDVHTKRIVN